MLLRRRQCQFPSAMPPVGKEGGTGSAPARQPHKKPVRALGRLVNSADASRSCGVAHSFVLSLRFATPKYNDGAKGMKAMNELTSKAESMENLLCLAFCTTSIASSLLRCQV
jgi:hypothetical protein